MTRYFPGGPRLAFFALLVAILAGAWYTVRPVVASLLLAAAVASLTHGAYRWLVRRLGGRRRTAAALLTFGLLVLVLGPLTLLGTVGASRLAAELTVLPWQLSRAQHAAAGLAERLGRLGPTVHRALEQAVSSIAGAAPGIANRVGGWAAAVGSAFLAGLIGLFLFTIALYYFFVDGLRWRERFIALVPIDGRHTRALLSRFHDVSLAVLVGNLGTSALHGFLSGIGYWLFGVSAPLVWALVTAVASFIPVFGTALVWVPLSVGVVMSSGWGRGLGLLAYCTVIVGGADNIARPFLMRGGMELHPLVVFVSVLGGVEAFGVSGVFLGPLLMALTVAALDIYQQDGQPNGSPGGPPAPGDRPPGDQLFVDPA